MAKSGTILTDKQKKKIISDYLRTENYSETARLNNVVPNTVKNIVKADKDFASKCKQKKEQNTKDILDYFDNTLEKQRNILSLSLEKMEKELKNDNVSIRDLVNIYGVFYDKALKVKELKNKSNENPKDKINNNILNIANLINDPKPNRSEDDV